MPLRKGLFNLQVTLFYSQVFHIWTDRGSSSNLAIAPPSPYSQSIACNVTLLHPILNTRTYEKCLKALYITHFNPLPLYLS